jgi:hypothetical protein
LNQKIKVLTASILTTLTTVAFAQKAAIDRTRFSSTFTSPQGLTEQCIALAKLPLGDYKLKDQIEERELCAINFYDNSIALCPKIWSTSPGTIIYDYKGVANSTEEAEATLCSQKTTMDSIAKFKQSMNQSDTSGTFSASSILYYHISRVLSATISVPPAVYRSMDKDAHYERVSTKANPSSTAKMNLAGWSWLQRGELNPNEYNPTSDLFTDSKRQIYGSIANDRGSRYGVEINGTRKSGWGKGQNFDFQKTPAFLALKSNLDLESAIAEGYNEAMLDPLMQNAFASGVPSKAQIVLWMNEVSEIAILDYIFSQQDRIGNIDFQWNWVYLDEKGNVQAKKVSDKKYKELTRANMNLIPVPKELKDKNPMLIQKTFIGDNDAGGLWNYANFAKSTGMLDGIDGVTPPLAHLNKDTYQGLLKLARDFKEKGENYKILQNEVKLIGYNDLGDKRFRQLIGNTILAANLLEKNCKENILKLDLVSFKKAVKNDFKADPTNCGIEQ